MNNSTSRQHWGASMPQTAAAAPPRPPPARRRGRPNYTARLAAVLAVLLVVIAATVAIQPRMALLEASPFATQAHALGAAGSFALGPILLAWRKGRTFHRVAGWFWVFMMAITIASSLFVRNPDTGGLSWIHLSSIFHAVTLTLAAAFAIRRNIKWHRRLMIFTYASGMLVGLATAFIPGRLMFEVVFG